MARLLVEHWWTCALADVQVVRIRRTVDRFGDRPEWHFGGGVPLIRAPGFWLRFSQMGPQVIYWPDRPQATVRFPPRHPQYRLEAGLSSDSDDDLPLHVWHPDSTPAAYSDLVPPVGNASIQSRARAAMHARARARVSGRRHLGGELGAALRRFWVERLHMGDALTCVSTLLGRGGWFLIRTLSVARTGFFRVLRGLWPFWI